MAKFDLSGASISATFKHLLQVRDTDSALFDGSGNQLDDFRISGSFNN